MKKHIAVLLALIITLSALTVSGMPVFALDGEESDKETVLWPYSDKDGGGWEPQYKEKPVEGELAEGNNSVTAGCWKFVAEEAGYYAYLNDYSEASVCSDIARIDNDNKAQIVFVDYAGDYTCASVTCSDGLTYKLFYAETPGTYFFDFFMYGVDNNPRWNFAIKRLGEAESLTPSKDSLCMGIDINSIWFEESVLCRIEEANIAFSGGEVCGCSPVGYADKWEPGTHTFDTTLSNGPVITVTVNMYSAAQSIEKIEMPEDFLPVIITSFANSDYSYLYAYTDVRDLEIIGLPENVDVYFNDGSVKRVPIEAVNRYLGKGSFEMSDGAEHTIIIEYDDPGCRFLIFIDDNFYKEIPAVVSRFLLLDLMEYATEALLVYLGLVYDIKYGFSVFESLRAFGDSMSSLNKRYREYNKEFRNDENTASFISALFKVL